MSQLPYEGSQLTDWWAHRRDSQAMQLICKAIVILLLLLGCSRRGNQNLPAAKLGSQNFGNAKIKLVFECNGDRFEIGCLR